MGKIPEEMQPLIKRMTNWQRNQWARAGYPIDRAVIRRFVHLKREDHGRAASKR